MLRKTAAFIQSVIDIVLPRKERTLRIAHYGAEDIVVSPAEHEGCGVSVTTLLQYRSRAAEDLIRALKYERSGHAAHLLAEVLAEYLREELAHIRAFSAKQMVLVPVPLHPLRERERGFNQVTRVLDALPLEFKNGTLTRIARDALVRTRATPQQTRLGRQERLKNVENAFALGILGHNDIHGCHIILIDDVTTTGATLAAAAKPLQGESCTLFALAHA